MDPSLLCEVTYDDGGAGPMDNLTEDDIVLLDADYQEEDTGPSPGSKRPAFKEKESTSPLKKARRLPPGARPPARPPPPALAPAPAPPPAGRPQPRPGLTQSKTWKYRQLAENQYTADIRKADLLKHYEPEPCVCKAPKEEEEACGSGCVNRSTYTECDAEVCKSGSSCTNLAIQRRQYAPGLERFMTAKKGWGVRARQSVSKGSFILEYTGEICSSRAFEARMLTRYTTDNHHYCLAIDNKTMIDAHRAGSECRFVNHACEPNCEMEKWTVGGLSRMALFSLRDILPGEEICYDYNFSLFNTDQGQECKCGAKECRGVIGGRGKDYLITIEDSVVVGGVPKPKPVRGGAPTGPVPALDPAGPTGQDLAWFRGLPAAVLAAVEKEAPRADQLPGLHIKCTVCNEQLNYKNRGDLHRHPELGVLLCSRCHKNHGRGGWTKDEEGNDEFCRWCSEGGQIYLCDFCPQAFCNKCLRWNLGRKYLKKIEDEEKWHCVKCDPTPLKELRATYWALTTFHKDKLTSRAAVRPVPAAGPATPRKVQQAANGRSPAGGKVATPGQKVAGLPSLAYTKLQQNTNKAAPGPAKSRVNGVHKLKPQVVQAPPAGPPAPHFLDSLLREAEESLSLVAREAASLHREWSQPGAGRGPTDVSRTARRLRTVLERGKAALGAADRRVVNTYRARVQGGQVGDIRPEGTVGGDLPAVIVAAEGEATIKDVVKPVEKEEEGIHDVSVDELEVEDEILDPTPNGEVKSEEENGTAGVKEEVDEDTKDTKVELDKNGDTAVHSSGGSDSKDGTLMAKVEDEKES